MAGSEIVQQGKQHAPAPHRRCIIHGFAGDGQHRGERQPYDHEDGVAERENINGDAEAAELERPGRNRHSLQLAQQEEYDRRHVRDEER